MALPPLSMANAWVGYGWRVKNNPCPIGVYENIESPPLTISILKYAHRVDT